MNSAFAHETVYPHIHPHASIPFWMDLLSGLLWFGGIALVIYAAIRLISYVRSRD